MIEVVFEDSGWKLKRDPEHEARTRVKYWISHQCEGKRYEVQRYFSIISEPCGYCGSVCPEGLQGLYNMLEYL